MMAVLLSAPLRGLHVSHIHQSGADAIRVGAVVVVVVAIGVDVPGVVGVVGVLQLEVLEYRLINEYSAQLLMNQLAYTVARWVYAEDKKLIDNIKGLDSGMLVYDQKDRPVILVNNEWSLNWILERNPGIQFLTVPSDVAKI